MAITFVQTRLRAYTPRRDGRVASWVAATGLIAIIVVAIGASIYAWRNDGDDPARIERAARPIQFQCERCGYTFSLIPTEFHEQWRDVNPSALPAESRHKAHCPKCNERYCAKMVDERLSDEERRRAVSTRPNPTAGQP
ncbi:MAG: hypothetical protein NTV86_18485 [Planctomycetota bacterium]|nr:hypothetical protein [Planctomycetota bacterium]